MDEERAAQGVDHLQAAALEMIEAARAFLDVAEQVVSDRERVAEAFTVVTDVARAAARGSRTPSVPDPAAEDDDERSGGVERITLSS